ncbi:holo-ACP synthase [Streptosporangium saharense]|uniref:holo-ACP synthase n=1 Tax=Streptosporangium saharense TaxID=1706840 RepID=UPI0036CB8FBB
MLLLPHTSTTTTELQRCRSAHSVRTSKEAVAKALGAPPGLSHLDAEVLPGAYGRPELRVLGTVAEVAVTLGVLRWHVSLTHDAGVAVAYVIAEG